MAFETEIEYDGDTYDLHINDIYECFEGIYPDTIDLEIAISKVIGDEKYYADSLALIYTERTRTYNPKTDHENLDSELYKIIIDKLNDTYAWKWGEERNC